MAKPLKYFKVKKKKKICIMLNGNCFIQILTRENVKYKKVSGNFKGIGP